MDKDTVFPAPPWVPDSARRYLAHTEAGRSIRDLARGAGCHASTILRQIRRIEMRRDDPLVDAALTALAQAGETPPRGRSGPAVSRAARAEGSAQMRYAIETGDTGAAGPLGQRALERQALPVLQRLTEPGAVLAVAEDMAQAVVVRDLDGQGSRTAVVAADIAQAMALQDWIACPRPGRISRYRITPAGRAALGRLLAGQESRARRHCEQGFAEAQGGFDTDEIEADRRPRYGCETPLAALARRRDRDGQPFLEVELVRAGERLREDFELAQMGARVTQDWDRFLTAGVSGGGRGGPGGAGRARARLAAALAALGPGLSDAALRCCCYMEGLETVERRLGWSARSGKIVLRIALEQLRQHYSGETETAQMIG